MARQTANYSNELQQEVPITGAFHCGVYRSATGGMAFPSGKAKLRKASLYTVTVNML
jgi:hypothetical protein